MSIIKTDMTKAKEIHKTNIRVAREPKLAALDVYFPSFCNCHFSKENLQV